MWIISKSHCEKFFFHIFAIHSSSKATVKNFFFDIFAIHSSSRHEKRCQMSVRLFSLFRGSIYQQCTVFDVLLLLLCDSLSLPNLAPNQVESNSWLVAKLCNQVALVSSTSQFVALQKCSKIE